MTRINLVPVDELSDQHLIREYQELPRCIKQDINTIDAPIQYKLGSGHMKWGKKHPLFLMKRYKLLCDEMIYREFTVNYPYQSLIEYIHETNCIKQEDFTNDYIPTNDDIEVSRSRIKEKIALKPNWYRWTKREKPY